jgi:hypothetical protein
MAFMRIGPPVVIFIFRKAVLPANARKAGTTFLAFHVIVFSEAEHH